MLEVHTALERRGSRRMSRYVYIVYIYIYIYIYIYDILKMVHAKLPAAARRKGWSNAPSPLGPWGREERDRQDCDDGEKDVFIMMSTGKGRGDFLT